VQITELTVQIGQRDKEIESLRLKITGFEKNGGDIQGRLRLLIDENQRLTTLIDERVVEIGRLNARLAILADADAKFKALTADNEKLTATLTEKLKIIEEWEIKYSVLEKLYISVKEATIELDYVKRKYEEACEITERSEPKLRLSVEARGSIQKQYGTSFLSAGTATAGGSFVGNFSPGLGLDGKRSILSPQY